MSTTAVTVRTEQIILPTYMPALPDRNPMFLEKRVYQGSSGKVYPLPFTDRLASQPIDRKWKAVWLENEYLRVMVLPEIGGRIHIVQDKTNGYDLIYRQNVIKPALVGLAGPWISGGIEFNWPQHHRPATFLPVDTAVEHGDDGSIILWCSDHDPMARMKAMHGICLRPGIARLELRVRAYNRTPHVQNFLWWANVATRVHEKYQSFFPPDVYYVADHARRSMSSYPLCQDRYYGVDYATRARAGVPANETPQQFIPKGNYLPNDLSFYANIPVPTSYMCMESNEDFFGGYDHAARAGIIHIANHHISPGKKQWTWGNHSFGYAWDRNLTDPGAAGGSPANEFSPYIEIMAGVYTDNQPDFSFLVPGETKTWSQFWYPIQQIGPAQHANLDAAVSLHLDKKNFRIGVSVTRSFPSAKLELTQNAHTKSWTADLAPGQPLLIEETQFAAGKAMLRLNNADGKTIIEYHPKPRTAGEIPAPAAGPPAPADIVSSDELFLTGLHLEQYRHATRSPTDYWLEAIRRDPLDARCNNSMGRWHLQKGELKSAEQHFRIAIQRQTRRNSNPYDGEPLYHLGLTLRYQLDANPTDTLFDQAYACFYKSTWNAAWTMAGYHALAEMDCRRGDWLQALDHLDHSLRFQTDNLRARDLKVIVLRKLNRGNEADSLLAETLKLDPLDWWARHLNGQTLECDLQTILDLVHDHARAGLYFEAIALLAATNDHPATGDNLLLPDQGWGARPIAFYTLAWLQARNGDDTAAAESCCRAAESSSDYCFPSRLEEITVLQSAIQTNPQDARAPYYLANLFYDRRRHEEAIELWECSIKLDAKFSISWRNLGIAYFNIRHNPRKARHAYDKAIAAAPNDARLLFERDQLWKRIGISPQKRLSALSKRRDLVDQRDDLTIELCALLNQTGKHQPALALLLARQFQPWEGGEGQALGQFVRSHLALGRIALRDNAAAIDHFQAALNPPQNLSESSHLLANQSDIHYWIGHALIAAHRRSEAKKHWEIAADFKGDFQVGSVRTFSEMTYFSARAMQKLGRKSGAKTLLRHLLKFAVDLFTADAKIDYFATSLPSLLLFDDDLQHRQQTTALFLQAQAHLGSGSTTKARVLLREVLQRDPNHALASDLFNELATGRGQKGMLL